MSESIPDYRRAIGRRPRQSAEHTRNEMLKAGVQQAILPTGSLRPLDSIPLESVVSESNVPRSAAYRQFPTKYAFTDALTDRLVQYADEPTARMFTEADLSTALVAAVSSPNSGRLAPSFHDIEASALASNAVRLQNTLRPGLVAAIDAIPDSELRVDLAQKLQASTDSASQRAGEFFTTVGQAFDYEMIEDVDARDLGSTAVTFLGGLALTPYDLRSSESFTTMLEVGSDAIVDGFMIPKE